MKRLSVPVLMLSLITVMGISSCDKNDNENSLSRSAQVIGTWNLTGLATDLNQDGVIDETEMIPATGNMASARLRFLVDHTGMAFGDFGPFNASEDFRWGFTDFENTLVIEGRGHSANLTVTYFQGNDMTLQYQQPGLPAIWGDFHKK